MNEHRCPRRGELGDTSVFKLPEHDTWTDRGAFKACSYCGSMSPADLFRSIGDGVGLTPTDKNYKVYVGGNAKFYFQHLNEDEKRRFIDMLNAGKVELDYPGRFYVLPYFISREPKAEVA